MFIATMDLLKVLRDAPMQTFIVAA